MPFPHLLAEVLSGSAVCDLGRCLNSVGWQVESCTTCHTYTMSLGCPYAHPRGQADPSGLSLGYRDISSCALCSQGRTLYWVSVSFSDRLSSQRAVFVLCSSAFVRPTCTFCRELTVPLLAQAVHMPEKGAVFEPTAVA